MLQKLAKDNFNEFYELIEKSFPNDEYRDYEGQRALLDRPDYRVDIYPKNGEIGAALATWRGPDFLFLEHFVVKSEFRGGGLGSALLNNFLKSKDAPIILETEIPEGEVEKRRIAFYKRNGFTLNPWGYDQPPLAEDQASVPLKIMSSPREMTQGEFAEFKAWAFSEVYNQRK